MKKIIKNWLPVAPMRLKILIAKMLRGMMTIENMQNDIVLYNELELYIKTYGRPTTSNPNYWINKNK